MADLMAPTDAMTDRILARMAGAGPATVSSENSPIQMTVDGRVERLRADQVADKGQCNPPWSAWGN